MTVSLLTDLTRDEQLAFLGMLRILVRMDGEFSPEEATAMHAVAKRVGSTVFWKAMSEAQAVFGTADQVFAAARTLQRDEVRRFVYDSLLEVATVDGIDPSEAQMLSWLRHEWNLEGP